MNFEPLTLADMEELRPFFNENPGRLCDATVGGTFMWRDLVSTERATEDGVLYLKVVYQGGVAFAPPLPMGAACPLERAVGRIAAYCDERDIAPRLVSVPECMLPPLLELYPGATATTDRSWTDYLYDAEDIRTLAGRRFSGQRNHINKFLKEYPDWSFDDVGPGNINAARAFITNYSREHAKDYPAYDEGNRKALEVLDNYALYGQVGGLLTVGDSVIGAAFGETAGDTLYIHTEKALTAYVGAYQMLVNQFARRFAPQDARYINREEDDGVEGLRTSKLSYHPAMLLDKYAVTLTGD